MYTPKPMAPIMAMVKMSSHVALIHWPKVGRELWALGPWWVVCVAGSRLRRPKSPPLFSWVPVAVAVLASTGAGRRLKKPIAEDLSEFEVVLRVEKRVKGERRGTCPTEQAATRWYGEEGADKQTTNSRRPVTSIPTRWSPLPNNNEELKTRLN